MARNGRKKIRVSTRRVIHKRDNGLCGICGNYASLQNSTIDHIVPVGNGGAERDYANLQIAHYECNQLKDDKGPEFRVVRTYGGWYNADVEKYNKCKICGGWMTWQFEYERVKKTPDEKEYKGKMVYVGQHCPTGC